MNGGITMTAPLKLLPLVLILVAAAPDGKPANSLTTEAKEAGWKLMCDGKTTDGWRGYQKDSMPPGWKVIDGALVRVSGGAGGKGAGGGGGSITGGEFGSFEV